MAAARSSLVEWSLVGVALAAALPIFIASSARVHAFAKPVAAGPVAAIPLASATRTGQRIGTLSIPRVSLRVPVIEGCSKETLQGGACRMVETAQIGGLGTVAIAGHRDSSFRALAGVRQGDVIRAAGLDGTFSYIVDSTQIVTPEQVEVVDNADRPSLVLITCYPFHFVGAAPRRFVVQAHLQLE